MKVELHLHTNRYSGCSVVSPEQALQRLSDLGYRAVFITEHDRVWSPLELIDLQDQFPWMKIFGGVELTIGYQRMQHLVVLGTSDPDYLAMTGDEAAILAKARAAGHLTILAHPFRWDDETMLDRGHKPDAIEYLTCNHDSPVMKARAKSAASTYGVRLVNSGDVHSPEFMDRYWIETDADIENPRDIRPIVLKRQYRNRRAQP